MLHARQDLVARAIMERTAAEVDIFMVMVNGREFVLLVVVVDTCSFGFCAYESSKSKVAGK